MAKLPSNSQKLDELRRHLDEGIEAKRGEFVEFNANNVIKRAKKRAKK